MALLAQFFSDHQGPKPIQPDRRRSDGKGSDWTSSINVQRIRKHNAILGLRIGPDELPFIAATGYKSFQAILIGTLLFGRDLIIDHDNCNGNLIEKLS